MSRTFNVDFPKDPCGSVEAHYNVYIYCKTMVSELLPMSFFCLLSNSKRTDPPQTLALHDSVIEKWWPSRLPADLCVILFSQKTNSTWRIRGLSVKSTVAEIRVWLHCKLIAPLVTCMSMQDSHLMTHNKYITTLVNYGQSSPHSVFEHMERH